MLVRRFGISALQPCAVERASRSGGGLSSSVGKSCAPAGCCGAGAPAPCRRAAPRAAALQGERPSSRRSGLASSTYAVVTNCSSMLRSSHVSWSSRSGAMPSRCVVCCRRKERDRGACATALHRRYYAVVSLLLRPRSGCKDYRTIVQSRTEPV